MLIIGRERFIGTENTPGLATVQVIPEAVRCMQGGICSFNCPAGIDVRDYAWQGKPLTTAPAWHAASVFSVALDAPYILSQ